MRRSALLIAVVGLLLSISSCMGDDGPAPDDGAVSTCDLVPLDVVATAIGLPGQSADDLRLSGDEYDPARDGTSELENAPLINECIVGDPTLATVRVTSLVQDTPAGTPEDVVGRSCDEVEPFPSSIDATGGTCLSVSTEARGRWGDQRIVVQLYRVDGPQPADRATATDIADQVSQDISAL